MDKKIRQLITRIKSYLIKLNGEKIKKVILYGSYARGEATKDSDIDALVVVDDSLDPSEVRKSRVFGISRCNDQNPGNFLIFSKRGFRKTTEDTESTEGTKGENNNSLCALWFNLTCHDRVL